MSNKPDCKPFLKLTKQSQKGLTVRVADVFIHALYTYPNAKNGILEKQYELYSKTDPVKRHRQHELFLMKLFKDCYKEIMNDPTVVYDNNRPHFSGKTGTMSQLVQNGYYNYYLALFELGVEANLIADAQTLLTQLVETVDMNKLSANEWASIQQIFAYAQQQGFVMPDRDWWDSILDYIEGKKAALSLWSWWTSNPTQHSWEQFWEWSPPKSIFSYPSPIISIQASLPQRSSYYVYEYYPYRSPNKGDPTRTYGSTTSTFQKDYKEAIQKFETLQDMFAPQEQNENADNENAANENEVANETKVKTNKGGGRRKRRTTRRRKSRKNTLQWTPSPFS